MGNSIGGKKRKTVKVMKINGETMKLNTPVKAEEVVKDYPPGYVLLESESVKHFGIRAKPVEPDQNLEPKRLYFLVELPAVRQVPRRARSGINVSAKDRLENLMLARRSVSDLSILKPVSAEFEEGDAEGSSGKRVKMRVSKKEVERLMKESENEAEVAAKIVDLCVASGGGGAAEVPRWNCERGRVRADCIKASTKRVNFQPISEGGNHIAVAS